MPSTEATSLRLEVDRLSARIPLATEVIDKAKLTQKHGIGHRHGHDKKDHAKSAVENEISVLKRVRHRNCINLLEVIDDPRAKIMFLVFELLAGGEVMQGLPEGQGIDEATARVVFRELL